jgi:hypothetical protein
LGTGIFGGEGFIMESWKEMDLLSCMQAVML